MTHESAETPRRIEQRGELRIWSDSEDFDPARVTQILGLEPAQAFRKGEPWRSGRTRNFSAWWWFTGELNEWDCEVPIRLVLDRFEAVADRVQEVQSLWPVTIQVGLYVRSFGALQDDGSGEPEVDMPTPALALSIETLKRLVALNASLDVDQYLSLGD